jgi:hypothetical protein
MKTLRLSLFLLFGAVLIGFPACHSAQKTGMSTTKDISLQEVCIDQACDVNTSGDAFKTDTAFVEKDMLTLRVNYGGGCKDHSFDLVSNGQFTKSIPPQVSLVLKHQANGDQCKNLVYRDLHFNISKLRYPGPNRKSVILHLGTFTLTYNY